jgi:hypothetical protein
MAALAALTQVAAPDFPYRAEITFVPAVATVDEGGSLSEPTITIWNNPRKLYQEPGYAFPVPTRRILDIYDQIFGGYQGWKLEYYPDQVRVIIPLQDLNQADDLEMHVNYYTLEAEDWGDLHLDEESKLFLDPKEEDLLYIPYLEKFQLLQKVKNKWIPF